MPFVGGVGGGSGTSPFVEVADVINKVTASNQFVLDATGTDEVQATVIRGTDAAPASNIIQVRDAADATTLMAIGPVGQVLFPAGTAASCGLQVNGVPTIGIYQRLAGRLSMRAGTCDVEVLNGSVIFNLDGNNRAQFSGTTAFTLQSAGSINFSSTTAGSGAPDIGINRNAAGVMALTNGSTGGGTLFLASGQAIQFSSTTTFGAADVFLTRGAAATLQHGAANAAAPVSQIIQAQGSRSGTDVDIAGGNLTIRPGAGTGAATPSTLIFQAAVAVASGSAVQTMVNRLTLSGEAAALGPYGAGAGETGELRFLELAAGGVNYTGFKAPDALAGNAIYELPAAFPGSNLVLQSTSAGVLSWVSASGSSPFLLSGTDIIYDPAAALVTRTKLGIADSATPLSQTLFVAGSVAGVDANVGGGSLTIMSGNGTGTGTPSTLIFQTPVVVGAGTGAQTMATRLTITGVDITAAVKLYVPSGTAAAPGITVGPSGAGQEGLYQTAGQVNISCAAVGVIAGAFVSGATGLLIAGIPSGGFIGEVMWTGGALTGTVDLRIRRRAAATLGLGGADSASPVSQTIQAQGSIGGTDVDVAGGNLTIVSGLGTGIGAVSVLEFRTPTLGVTGSAQQVANLRLQISQIFSSFRNRAQFSKGADVASATDMTLGADGNAFDITGTTQIDTIVATDWQAGSVIILQFDSNPTVKHNTAGTGASLALAGGVDFVASAGDTLTLYYDGTVWREIGRAVI